MHKSLQEPVFQQPFSERKKDGQYRTVVNLNSLNQFLPYHNFNMEDLEEILLGRNAVIFVFQILGFAINKEMSWL